MFQLSYSSGLSKETTKAIEKPDSEVLLWSTHRKRNNKNKLGDLLPRNKQLR
jgi:hypothetical protein